MSWRALVSSSISRIDASLAGAVFAAKAPEHISIQTKAPISSLFMRFLCVECHHQRCRSIIAEPTLPAHRNPCCEAAIALTPARLVPTIAGLSSGAHLRRDSPYILILHSRDLPAGLVL